MYNFDETGYMLGIAATTKVITAADKQKPKQVQPGNCEWVIAVECINACGWSIPPMMIFKGRVHMESWYQNGEIPHNWRISLSENGWTTDEIGLL
jgi:hypothetical protein